MNNVIKRELEKIHASLPPYTDETTHIFIPKAAGSTTPKFEIGSQYIVKLANYILHESTNFTLSSNWNKGIVPKSETLIIYIKAFSGKMLRVCGRGIDIETNQYLSDIYDDFWLPESGVEILYKL